MRNVSTLTSLAALENAQQQIRRGVPTSSGSLPQSIAAQPTNAEMLAFNKELGLVAEAIDEIPPTGCSTSTPSIAVGYSDEEQLAAQAGALAAAGALLMAKQGLGGGCLSHWPDLHTSPSPGPVSLTDRCKEILSHLPQHRQQQTEGTPWDQQHPLDQPDLSWVFPPHLDMQMHLQIRTQPTHARAEEKDFLPIFGPHLQDAEPDYEFRPMFGPHLRDADAASRGAWEARFPFVAVHPLGLQGSQDDGLGRCPSPQSATTTRISSDDLFVLFSSAPPGEAAPAHRRPVPALDIALRELDAATGSKSPTSSAGSSPSRRAASLIGAPSYDSLARLMQPQQRLLASRGTERAGPMLLSERS
jgi:hypothetical protein